MDFEKTPRQEPELQPSELPLIPVEMEPLDTMEELPVIEELDFRPEEIPGPAEIPVTPETSEEAVPEIIPEEIPAEEPPVPEEIPMEEPVLPEEIPVEAEEPALPAQIPEELEGPAISEVLPEPAQQEPPEEAPARPLSFMERIPDVEEDYPQEVSQPPVQDLFTEPEVGQEITPDEKAMDFHGMLEHGEEEPPFDLSILNDPTFAPSPAPQAPQEEVNDQEYRDNGKEFDEMFAAPAAKKALPAHQRAPYKGRPKRKKGDGLLGIPNFLVTIVWLMLIVFIGTTLGRMLWVCAADVLAFGREDKPVTITIYEADTMEEITNKLYENGLIRYRSLFSLYAGISNAEEDIKPGIYDLNTRYDYHALVNFMSPRSSREVIKVTIPEGYTCRQIFALLEENRICTAVDAASYAASGELRDYWFLEGLERGTENCLEGYLFPDTYEFYKNSTPREALEKMLNNFEHRFSEEMRGQLDVLNANVTGGTFGIREVVIVASLIEKESAAPGESPNIAGVIYNRLFDWGNTPAFLNIDASIVYAQDGNTDHIDTSIDSPYNTYTNVGLTPGPIANPGLSSLQAALSPESHDYYYYVLNPSTGMHTFSTTLEEHNANVARFSEG